MHDPVVAAVSRRGRIARLACVAGLSAALTFGGVSAVVAPTPAYAASAQTMSQLSQLQSQVQSASSTYQQATANVDALNKQIDEMAAEILDLEQHQLPAQQAKAQDAVRNLYKMQAGSSNTISKLLTATSLSDFFTMNKYLSTIKDDNTEALKKLQDLDAELSDKMAQLSAARTQADAEQKKAADALSSAQSAAAKMQQQADAENAAEAEAARQAAAQAAAMKAAAEQKQQAAAAAAAQAAKDERPGLTAPASGTSQAAPQQHAPAQNSKPAQNGGGSASSTAGWKSGVASYYGIGDGFMGGITASGASVTETSMGIAMLNVPLGSYVEISFGGRSVVAVVNDRGPYHPGRVIDMQPAVARALGFTSVGVGTVQYRIL